MPEANISEHLPSQPRYIQQREGGESKGNKQWTSLSCTICFPISDHEMLLLGTVSFKCRLVHVHIYMHNSQSEVK